MSPSGMYFSRWDTLGYGRSVYMLILAFLAFGEIGDGTVQKFNASSPGTSTGVFL